MSETVLYADEEKAGPASVAMVTPGLVGDKTAEEFRNYKNSKRQAVTSALHTRRAPALSPPQHSSLWRPSYRVLVS